PSFPEDSFTVSAAFLNVTNTKTGKSGGSSNPPKLASPVKLLILNSFTPGALATPGMKPSKEIKPTLMVSAQVTAGWTSWTANTVNQNNLPAVPGALRLMFAPIRAFGSDWHSTA